MNGSRRTVASATNNRRRRSDAFENRLRSTRCEQKHYITVPFPFLVLRAQLSPLRVPGQRSHRSPRR